LTEQEILSFAERFGEAVQSGDIAAFRACYAADAKIWHNHDNIEQTLDQNIKALAWFMRVLPDRFYRVQRRAALKDGFLQQHVLEATLPDGTKWRMAACVVVKMENGVIARLDEYLDSAALLPLKGLGR
jgi:ketosteroid isomerase-like protein